MVAVSDDAALLDALGGRRGRRCCADATWTPRWRSPRRSRPSTCSSPGAAAEALAPRVRSAGCLFVGIESGTAFGDYVAGSNHTLPTDGAARFASGLSARALPPPHGRGPRRRRGRGALARAGAPIARAEGFERARRVDGDPGESAAAMSAAPRRSPARPARPTSRSRSALDGSGAGTRATGVGFLDHMLDLLARHGRLDLEVARRPATCRPARTTRSRTPGSCSARRSTSALGDRRGIVRYGHAVVPMDEARAACAIDVSGPPVRAIEGFERLPAGDIAGFEHELAEEFFRAVASTARLTLHLELQAGTNAHHMIEACFKAFARALRAAVAIDPTETGDPVDEGHADVIAIVDYGMGNRRSVEKALEHVGAEPVLTADHDALRAADGDRGPRRRRVPGGDAPLPARPASTSCCAERADAGVPRARPVPGHAAAVRALRRARGRDAGSGCCPAA